MLNINDLWIGEVVRLKKSGRVGRFEGVRDGKGVINVDGKIVLAAPRLIELYKASDDNKGIGTLRNEIKHLISLYDEIKIDYLTNNGGATEIIIMK